MSNAVVYTSVFGGYDDIVEQKVPNGWDWKCFSEDNSLSLYNDNTRNAKRFKVLPHRYLSDYEYSIFIDGNMTIKGDVNELVDKYLKDSNVAFFSHAKNVLDSRDCVYDEAKLIFKSGERWMNETPERGLLNWKDKPELIKTQIEKYALLGYPKHNGLITGMVILRRHNEKDCIKAMEDWWTEIKYNSKRDQLSFNYIAWKNNLNFNYIDGDSRNNKYFYRDTKPHKGKL